MYDRPLPEIPSHTKSKTRFLYPEAATSEMQKLKSVWQQLGAVAQPGREDVPCILAPGWSTDPMNPMPNSV